MTGTMELPELKTTKERLQWACARKGIKGGAALRHLVGDRVSDALARSNWNGHRDVSSEAAKIYAASLDVPWQWLCGHDVDGAPPQFSKVSSLSEGQTVFRHKEWLAEYKATQEPTAAITELPTPSPQPLPITGSVAGGAKEDGAFEMNGSPVDWTERPHHLAGVADAYAVYCWGSSMEPRFRAGDLLYVNPHKPVRSGDAVVVQIRSGNAAPLAYVKSYISQNDSILILEQINPSKRLEWPLDDVVSVHRIVGTLEA